MILSSWNVPSKFIWGTQIDWICLLITSPSADMLPLLTHTKSNEWLITVLISRWAAAAFLISVASRQMLKEQGDIMLRHVLHSSLLTCSLFSFSGPGVISPFYNPFLLKFAFFRGKVILLFQHFFEGCLIHAQYELLLLLSVRLILLHFHRVTSARSCLALTIFDKVQIRQIY